MYIEVIILIIRLKHNILRIVNYINSRSNSYIINKLYMKGRRHKNKCSRRFLIFLHIVGN